MLGHISSKELAVTEFEVSQNLDSEQAQCHMAAVGGPLMGWHLESAARVHHGKVSSPAPLTNLPKSSLQELRTLTNMCWVACLILPDQPFDSFRVLGK